MQRFCMHFGHGKGIRYRDGVITEIEDNVVLEETVAIYYNGELITEQIASYEFLAELGIGFVINEGITTSIDNVEVEEGAIYVTGPTRKDTGPWITESSGGASSTVPPQTLQELKPVTVSPATVEAVIAAIQSDEWVKTGGLHCSVLFRNDEFLIRCVDIGRHNSVDKVVGWAFLHNIDLRECVIGCTGRQPTGMVRKVAHAQIPVIISRAATSTKGIETAIKTGITLIGFARQGRFTVYSHPERVIFPETSLHA
jgi:FdhD protein